MEGKIIKLIADLKREAIKFKDVIAFIDAHYDHQPAAFKNGDAYNDATQNQGSAKVFTFAQLNSLSEKDTLMLFAEHYMAVLDTSEGTDHQNIRQFMKHGWGGVAFEAQALIAK